VSTSPAHGGGGGLRLVSHYASVRVLLLLEVINSIPLGLLRITSGMCVWLVEMAVHLRTLGDGQRRARVNGRAVVAPREGDMKGDVRVRRREGVEAMLQMNARACRMTGGWEA
jgi:hypothetical protein